jgi:hypothetical protein
MGTITNVDIYVAGNGYTIGDQLTIIAGNNDLIVNVDYVGIGDYSKFNGQRKQYNSWI